MCDLRAQQANCQVAPSYQGKTVLPFLSLESLGLEEETEVRLHPRAEGVMAGSVGTDRQCQSGLCRVSRGRAGEGTARDDTMEDESSMGSTTKGSLALG